jgi:uncharacterized Zn-binding protein involved in type VI secretion
LGKDGDLYDKKLLDKKFGEKEKSVGDKAPKDEFRGNKKWGPLFQTKGEGAVWSSKDKGSETKSFVSVLKGEYSVEVGSAAVDIQKLKGKLTIVDAKASATVAHGQFDLGSAVTRLFHGDDPKPAPLPPPPPGPMAARITDLTAHGFPLVGGPCSPNVLIGGLPAWRAVVDLHVCPMYHGAGAAAPGSPSVLINGAPAARASDFVIEATGGPDMIALGCPTVYIGMMAPPPQPSPPKPTAPPSPPSVKFESVVTGDVGTAEAKANASAMVDLRNKKGSVKGEAGAMAAVLKGEVPLKLKIKIPFTSMYLGLGVTLEGTLLSAGAQGEARAAVNEGKDFFSGTAGAKVGVGLGGVGAKFNVTLGE